MADIKPESHSVFVPQAGEYQELVACDNCAFVYSADHVTELGYICPVCSEERLVLQLAASQAREAALRELLQLNHDHLLDDCIVLIRAALAPEVGA